MKKKIDKKFFFLEMVASKLAALNCLYEEKNICDRQSICLKSRPKILLITKRDFFEFSCLCSD